MTAAPTALRLGIKPAALPAWRALQAFLAESGPTPCAGDDRFTSDDPDARSEAADRCLDCLAMWRCAEFATANRETFGVYAGRDLTTPRGRPAARRMETA